MEKEQNQFIFEVRSRDAGKRVDLFLSEWLRGVGGKERSRSDIRSFIEEKGVFVNKKLVQKPGQKLRAGEKVEGVWEELRVSKDTQEELPKEMTPRVVFEHERFLAIEKPAGIEVFSVDKPWKTVVDWYKKAYNKESESIGVDGRFGVVHRLDRETSGLLLLARDSEAAKILKDLFRERKIQKEYQALVFGNFVDMSGIITKSIARIPHSLKRRVATPEDHDLRYAETEYFVQKRLKGFDFLLMKPKTGRTHQIRVHLLSAGHPIVGDKVYGRRLSRDALIEIKRHFLHASGLRFEAFGEDFEFSSPLPDDLKSVLSFLEHSDE